MFIVIIPPPLCTILGTKIQATLFNKHIKTWKDSLKQNKSYYIAKGRLDRVNPNYFSVHKEVEFTFTDNTIIKATDIEVSTHRFYVGFVSLDHVDKLPNGAILVSTNPLTEKEYSKRREIVVTNEQHEMVEAENKDFMITPSKEMRRAIEAPLVYIIDGLLVDSQVHTILYFYSLKIITILISKI
ncbi:hypothetical protein H5410_056153 [Solanum commersonii]|uniref:Uncharacterized protein n=1 Tax=Solanum commersonii TaxID=4109 RepID=A0A9J5WJH1_SOLCO|nr:hypothetical protein H5410_056153 [Solanum commersonii]